MSNWRQCLQFVLLLFFTPKSMAEYVEEDLYKIDMDKIDMKISNTSHVISVTWKPPNNKSDPRCYTSEVQCKSQCVKDWERGLKYKLEHKNEEYGLNMSTLSMKKNYDFRIRMMLSCIGGEWSNWTQVQHWGNNTDACMEESSSYIWIYVLIPVLPMTGLLLMYLFTQESIRRLILPVVPDPKHLKNKIIDIDQSQWWSNLTQCSEECTTTDIEIINKSERDGDDQTLVIQSMGISPAPSNKTTCTASTPLKPPA
ncbi:cytokine receptor common subunit gamma-like [Xyrauchen texanus]|uniref:cytokine receptor common subunit gamma-like n=1 Tax=Xyrauchen texanus TaxID=154827 RepID=UPI0022423AE3|nr:cytokine receptor common subunit gamma-like [Xyrauchen texanus]